MPKRWRSVALTAALVAGALTGVGAAVPQVANAAPLICEQYGSARVDGGRYIVQNNRWGASTAQCIDVRGNGFAVTRADHNNPTNGPPAAYPSIFAGCHYTLCTTNSGLPLRVSQFGNVRATYQIDTPNSGEWNASFDLWFDPTQRTDGQNTGAEVMIWANRRGRPQPIGSPRATVTIEGATWDVWIGNIGWNVISYVRQQPSDDLTNFSVNAFVNDAVSRGQIDRNWFMTSVQAGFEPWIGGAGLGVRNFAFTTNGSGGGGGGGGGGGASWAGSIVGRGSGRCVDVDAGRNADGTKIQLWDCLNNAPQRWERRGDTFVNPGTGKCLDVAGGNTANGTQVRLWTCNGSGAQRWAPRGDGGLIHVPSGRCLDAVGLGTGNGTPLQIWACNGNGAAPNQAWTLR